tara:strand:- start:2577 stop:3050 length:474 start_codon:yes stop_codon:yes gene_type:complete
MRNTLTLIRGLPGAGKSTVAKKMVDQFRQGVKKVNVHIYEADDWFYDDEGNYIFDPKDLAKAHQWCQRRTWIALEKGDSVVVSNTFTCRWEMEPYLQMAEEHGLKVTVLNVFDANLSDEELAARNVHGVPLAAIKRMRDRFEHDWESGHPLPPWERS